MRSLYPPRLLAVLLLVSAGCPRSEERAPAVALPPPAPAQAPRAPAFLADDWEEAKRQALGAGKLVFVDGWAPWCHTCWSVKREVLHDPALAPFTNRFVFLEVDTDRTQNAAFVARFPQRAWPTFFVIEPASERILAMHGGSLSLAELVAFLASAEQARAQGGPAEDALAAAYASLQEGEPAAAAGHFERAASHVGKRRTEAIHGAMRALRQAKEPGRCASFGQRFLDVAEGSAARGDLAALTLLCSQQLPNNSLEGQAAGAAARVVLEHLVAAPPADASVDDRADLMGTLAELYASTGKEREALALHRQRLALLEGDALTAAGPTAARVHDYARMNSYLALGRGDDAVALLKERTAQLPDDYEAVARLAYALYRLERFDEALSPAERAVELSYGPRRLRYLELVARVQRARGEAAAERRALEELARSNEALPEGARLADLATAAAARLAALAPD
jgi:tetratricopeptide (TPR) repeat protein